MTEQESHLCEKFDKGMVLDGTDPAPPLRVYAKVGNDYDSDVDEGGARAEPQTQLAPLLDRLEKAAATIADADAILICTGAGMGVDSGFGTFRGRNAGVWSPLKGMNIDYTDICCPSYFYRDPFLGWGFWKFCYQAYHINGRPHEGYRILSQWGQRKNLFSMTSNIDGHWSRTPGIPADRLYECHGAVTHMQHINGDGEIWETDPAVMRQMVQPDWDLVPGEVVEIVLQQGYSGTALPPNAVWQRGVVGEDGMTIHPHYSDGKPSKAACLKAVRRIGGPDLTRILPACPLPTVPLSHVVSSDPTLKAPLSMSIAELKAEIIAHEGSVFAGKEQMQGLVEKTEFAELVGRLRCQAQRARPNVYMFGDGEMNWSRVKTQSENFKTPNQ